MIFDSAGLQCTCTTVISGCSRRSTAALKRLNLKAALTNLFWQGNGKRVIFRIGTESHTKICFVNILGTSTSKPSKSDAKNLPKSKPNSFKIHPKTIQNPSLEGVWAPITANLRSRFRRHLGGVLGRPGGVFGSSWGRLEAPRSLLEALWVVLSAFLGHWEGAQRKIWNS